ncbi:MAG: hypothetical protein AVDCRST_MAG85-337 [uncultured Solirubrobacteraceae bacterium]|uniref:Uncharacterized protein n=1 Tax=uncultured Solirubrobacteraceae bacterium TaxID=1162706 RepID=A0A6J4RKY7_9ACTN|nr:MAG: hypothetical protein AVDCRST_MAG85-337 [uncultured Solirubrobacteraceae bacterium]
MAASAREPEAARIEVFQGILLAAFGLTALPLLAYYALGRFVEGRAILAAAWLLSLAPLGVGLFFGWWWTLDLIACPYGSSECPL